MRVDERRRFGTDRNGREGAAIDVERITFETEGQTQAVHYLDRIDPGLEIATFVPEERGAAADDIEKRARMRRAR